MAAAAAAVAVVASATLQADVSGDGPRLHPAEAAFALFVTPVQHRQVVRNEDGGYDVWLHGGAPFDKVGERIAAAAGVRLELPDGWILAKATFVDADRSIWVDLDGPGELRARLTRDRDGTLVELRHAGLRRDAAPWAPPFAPLPLNLLHGPMR